MSDHPGHKERRAESGPLAPPPLALPKGGGAIRGIGEKFAANPVTGTGSMSIPIASSPGRSGFGPQLSLTYDSGSGNGPFGFGWRLSLPAVTRKTDTGLPLYRDAEESDVFLLAGAEDLVPADRPDDEVDGYRVRRYRPRIEGAFARIERWSRIGAPDDVHWRSVSRDDVLTVYGLDAGSRIVDPLDASRVFSWLVCEVRDSRGNAVLYRYRPDDGTGVEVADLHERNRGPRDDVRRTANRYPKRVLYGNRTPLIDTTTGLRPRFLAPARLAAADWMFELVFDYGDHDPLTPTPHDDELPGQQPGTRRYPWPLRPDAFSSYRAGFEVRTTRLCKRVLMFHHFEGEAGVGRDCLVRSTELTHTGDVDPVAADVPVYSFLRAVTHAGYRRTATGYERRALPAVEFDYTRPELAANVEEPDPESLRNLPEGLDGGTYLWADLHGEAVPGILTEQAGAWFYKRNLSPLPQPTPDGVALVRARFAPLETVAVQPGATLGDGARLMDLAGDGLPDLVRLDGPAPGLYEHDDGEGWRGFRPFTSLPNLDLGDPNVTLVDLDGDGRADVLVTEDDALVWYPSRGEEGFGPARRVPVPPDEELGPRVVLADATQCVQLADLSGDGLADLVRIRNGEICYWPNLGHGRFGAKVGMSGAPWFDHPDRFDHRRIRLVDIDGSGTTDLVYLHDDGVRVHFNQCGNGWSRPQRLPVFPPVDDTVGVLPVDLLGNGTACLVWSSPAADSDRRPLRYVNLMTRKPHLLERSSNNLGAEVHVEYAPSTEFSLRDRQAGRPWVTRLPVPVHVVRRVTTYDHVSRSRFVTRYAYHHGHYDGEEREFRGFGMVEQWDAEELAALRPAGVPRPEGAGGEPQVPPVHTKTWFHTGVQLGRDHVSDYFAGLHGQEGEYFREPGLTDAGARALLLPDTTLPAGLTTDEEREACRALKGSMLRREVYAEDAAPDAGPDARRRAETPYTVTEQSFAVRRLQPRGDRRHAVLLVEPRETLLLHYERDAADPRVQHTLTLEVGPFGDVLKQADVGYGRRPQVRVVAANGPVQSVPNPGLAELDPDDRAKQTTTLVTYRESAVTDAIDTSWAYRTPMPSETVTYELTGYLATGPAGRFRAADLVEPDPTLPGRLRHRYTDEVAYEAEPTAERCRRPVERVRTLYRSDDLTALLPLGQVQPLALAGEGYSLALTPGLLDGVLRRPHAGEPDEMLLPDPAAVLGTGAANEGDRGGYVASQTLKADGRFPATDPDDHWWAPTGRTFHTTDPDDDAAAEATEARRHFFLGRRVRDPFGHDTVVDFDGHDLLVIATSDAVGNRVTAEANDYRVLQPRVVADANGNRTEVAFDALGLVAGVAVMGKAAPAPVEGDTLAGFAADLTPGQLATLFDAADPAAGTAALLAGATTRIAYDLHRFRRTRAAEPGDPARWEPAGVATLTRDTHESSAPPPGGARIQLGFTYSDGFGREIQKKLQAEPERTGRVAGRPRWVGSGWTVFDAKGRPVRTYEPFFSRRRQPDGTDAGDHRFEFGVVAGVSPVLFYDPVGRVVATLHPDHTYEKVVFDPWRHTTYDVNDTCAPRNAQTGDPRTDPDILGYVAGWFAGLPASPPGPAWRTWRELRAGGALGSFEATAAERAAAHADTPTTVHLDTLGRPFLTVERNRVACPGHDLDGTQDAVRTWVELDVEGNRRAVADERRVAVGHRPTGALERRTVIRYDHDLLGNVLRQRSMEAGARWLLPDVSGRPVRSWDSRGHTLTTRYDALRRPLTTTVRGSIAAGAAASDPRTLGRDVVVDRIEYGEPPPGADAAERERATRLNLRTRVLRHFDTAGVVTNARLDPAGVPVEAYDFKGNPLRTTRRFLADHTALPDWSGAGVAPVLQAEAFESAQRYDALNRVVQIVAPHSNLRPTRHVVQPVFNEANLLERVDVWLERGADPAALLDPAAEAPSEAGVAGVDYDARGRRLQIRYRNGASTRYTYDRDTSRLTTLVTERGGTALQALGYTYDPAGNVTHVRDDAQQTLFFRNRRIEPDSDYVYDARYRLVQAAGREHLGLAANGDRRPPTASDGFDAFHSGLDHRGDGDALGSYVERYVHDAVGALLALQHRGTDPVHRGWTRVFDHTETSALEDGTGGGALRAGNRLTSSTLNPDSANPRTDGYTYDAHGNLTRLPHLGGGAAGPNTSWDHADRLCRTELGGGGIAHYVYDAAGNRVRKVWQKAPGLVEERLYLGGFEVFRRHDGPIGADTAVLERETLHVMDDARRVALVEIRTRDTAGTDLAPRRLIRCQFGNHLDSASLELDEQAQIISYEEYSPYGSTTYQAMRSRTETPKRYRYTGKERDEETGLTYHGARYYAPWLARWTAPDPALPEDGVNAYAYVSGNPGTYVDGSGRAATPPPLTTPLPEGIGFIGDYEDWSSLWQKALDKALEGKYQSGSPAQNLKLHNEALDKMIKDNKGWLGSNTAEGTAINRAREIYSRARTEFGKLADGALSGIQVHHAIEELAADPRMALSAENLIFGRGQAASEGTLHWMLHEINRLSAQGVKNPGRQAMINALQHGKISPGLVSPTLLTESANAKALAGAEKAMATEGTELAVAVDKVAVGAVGDAEKAASKFVSGARGKGLLVGAFLAVGFYAWSGDAYAAGQILNPVSNITDGHDPHGSYVLAGIKDLIANSPFGIVHAALELGRAGGFAWIGGKAEAGLRATSEAAGISQVERDWTWELTRMFTP